LDRPNFIVTFYNSFMFEAEMFNSFTMSPSSTSACVCSPVQKCGPENKCSAAVAAAAAGKSLRSQCFDHFLRQSGVLLVLLYYSAVAQINTKFGVEF
jgi:hypothetical protein